MQEEPGKPCRPSNTNHSHRYDAVHYHVGTDDYPLKFVSLYTPDNEDDRADTLPPPSSIAASSSIGAFSKARRTLKDIFLDFCDRTSSHGIPHIASSPTLLGKLIWTVVFIACSVVFAYQTYLTVYDYMRWRTLIEIELKFEAAAFPAVTVCNLNPHKQSLLFNLTEVQEVYSQYLHVMKQTTATHKSWVSRTKREVRYRPIYVNCRCIDPEQECVPLYNLEEPDQTTCLCFEDEQSGDIWPCYQASVWTTGRRCNNCSLTNSCELPSDGGGDDGSVGVPCICQSISHKCIKSPPIGSIPWWRPLDYRRYNITTTTTTTTTTLPTTTVDMSRSPFVEKENAGTATDRLNKYLTGLVALMDHEARFNLSYTVNELIEWCMFNAKPCDLEEDFRLQHDPAYGNCYTFNSNQTHPAKNNRAGPTHGLRMLLNVHQFDYMPQVEAAGVRIVIHDQDHAPFPDSLGYSAPTGMISSFGLKCQKMKRIRACQNEVLDGYYIYNESYTAEGCIRSCFQRHAIEECGCGDPKYPVMHWQRTCNPRVNETRPQMEETDEDPKLWLSQEAVCLLRFTEQFSKMIHESTEGTGKRYCICDQPCNDTIYQSSYSAATWPAENFVIHGVCPDGRNMTDCIEYVRKNTALVEIFFEQLSYEDLSEVEAYSIIKLLADFGGNIGLWIGFSVITFVEFLELIVEVVTFGYGRARTSARRNRKKPRYTRPVAFQYVNRVAEESFQNDPPSSVEDWDRSHPAAHSSKK